MPKTATPETTSEPDALSELRQRIEKLQRDAAATYAEEQKLAAEAERLKEDARNRHAQREKLEREIAKAEREAIDAERQIPADPVGFDAAEQVAQTLLNAFDDVEQSPQDAEQRAEALWRAIDDARVRLLTDQVSEEGRPIVLATEGVIQAADDWEFARRPEAADARGPDGEVLPDIRWQRDPSASNVVRTALHELRLVLANSTPERAVEGIGELIGQSVSINQICRMHNLQLADGSPDVGGLGILIDRALGTSGFYRDINPWSHLKRLGAMNRSDAWRLRSSTLEARRQASHSLPGAAQIAGTLRTGRMVNPPESESVDHRPLHESDPQHAFFHRQKAEAARQAQQAVRGQ